MKVELTPVAERDLSQLRGKADKSAEAAVGALASRGCEAANYRLSGPDVEHICVVTLFGSYRMMVAFPDSQTAWVLLVGTHDEQNPAIDVYQRLYRSLGIDVPSEERRKPPCCDEEEPPVDPQLVDRFVEGSKQLAREDRRARRRRRHGAR